jgi:hypothetical protein
VVPSSLIAVHSVIQEEVVLHFQVSTGSIWLPLYTLRNQLGVSRQVPRRYGSLHKLFSDVSMRKMKGEFLS